MLYRFYKNLGTITPEFSFPFESESIPEIQDGWDGVLNQEEYLAYITPISFTNPPITYFKLNNSLDSPINLNYDLYGLHKKRTFNQGELSLTEYFKNYSNGIYSDLVVSESRVYSRDVNNLVQYRTQTISWYLTDETVGDTKVTIKYYDITESMLESETRRTNLISTAKLYTASQVGISDALDFMESINNEISLYIQGLTQNLFDAINASTKPYVTIELKATLISILTIV